MLEAQGRREFVGQADQVAAARRFVVSAIHAGGPARDVTRLLVSEAATNAILHSASGDGGTFAVQYLVSDDLVRVEVHDGGGPTSPRRRVHDLESITGRGLRGTIEGRLYHVGSHRLAEDLGRCSSAAEAELARFEVEDQAWRRAVLSDDRREGIAAWVERRDPDWPGG